MDTQHLTAMQRAFTPCRAMRNHPDDHFRGFTKMIRADDWAARGCA